MILSGLLTWAVTIISLSAAAMMLFVAMGFEWMLQAGDVVCQAAPGSYYVTRQPQQDRRNPDIHQYSEFLIC